MIGCTTPVAAMLCESSVSLAGSIDAAQVQIYTDGALLAMTQLLRVDEVAERVGKSHEALLCSKLTYWSQIVLKRFVKRIRSWPSHTMV